MIKKILVCTDGSAHSDTACQYAWSLTRKLGGALTGLHVLDSRMLEGPMLADISGWVGAQPFGTQLQQFRGLMQQKGEAIIQAFQDESKQQSVEAEGWVKMGHPVAVILEDETGAELVILGQKGEHADLGGEMMGSTVERLVRQSIKPCLVTPAAYREIDKVLIAYDGSAHASQALHEAIELAQALAIPMAVLTVAEDKDMDRANQVSREGLKLAEAHGLKAAHLVVKGPADVGILRAAEEHGYSLIVMGAHGHSRIRELILGSVTTQVLARATVPVMLVR